MDVESFLNEIRAAPGYRNQIVFVHEEPGRAARYAPDDLPLLPATQAMLVDQGVERLYCHQAAAIRAVRDGRDVLVVTGTASGKSLCHVVPIIEMLQADPTSRALLLFPTKALSQDQFRAFRAALDAAGLDLLAGVYDGDTSPSLRRKLRDHAAVIFSNPDMLHASMMAQHGRWASFLANLGCLVLDELHVYNGIFGANMANLMRRFERVGSHYGSAPRIIASSATIGNPAELGGRLTDRRLEVIDDDGSPRGRRVYVFWNPPRIRTAQWRSRRSANVEAMELMGELIRREVPTITFSKAKMSAEMIHRYVCEYLGQTAPRLVGKVTAYRGGYRPAERREIERRLFAGELLGVSTTRALELGIDVGALEACIEVGYPGTLASFYQQSGRTGRGERDSLVILVGLDTTVNQYIMTHPEYLFERPVEQVVIDPDNPFITLGHLRCAAHEIPLAIEETDRFGPRTELVLRVLEGNRKVRRLDGRWYHAATETPQYELSLRNVVDANVVIEDAESGEVLGEVNRLDAPPILHEGAIYLHQGDTYRVLSLDLEEKNLATVQRVEVDYYTQPLGGTDIHHVDAILRQKPFGAGEAYWGEVTAYFGTEMYEKIRFYELDAVSRHAVELPTFQLETMALWLVPSEELTEVVSRSGLNAHSGLRAIGYATRMLMPLFVTCQTLDFSHTIGSVNSPWNAIFIYERFPLGLGYTRRAYDLLDRLMPYVLDHIRRCPCDDGCPCCVGKPLRQYATWNVERGEASIPSKSAGLMILEGMLGDGTNLSCPDTLAPSESEPAESLRLEQALRRRLERAREPRQLFHPIEPQPEVRCPDAERPETLDTPDVTRRKGRRTTFHRQLRRRLRSRTEGEEPAIEPGPDPSPEPMPAPDGAEADTVELGDSLARRARQMRRRRDDK